MKQKVNRNKDSSSSSVIRTILREELKKFATKNDLFNLKLEVFAELSKTELKAIDRKQNYHSNVMTQFDKTMKTLEIIREDLEIGNFQTQT